MIVTELTGQDRTAWDEYVEHAPCGMPFQLAGWQDVLGRTYGYDTPYLVARDGQLVVGVLPLFAVRSPLTGKVLMTPPGGMCADSDEVAAALLDEGRQIARRLKLDRLVLHDSRRAWPGEIDTSSHHVAWITDICQGIDAMWKKVDRNVRRLVRRGLENNLRVESDRSGRLADDFYYVMSRFTHEMGTPVFGRSFVQNVVDTFPGRFTITTIYQERQVVGAYFAMDLGATNFGMWGSTIHKYLHLHASYLAYWKMFENAAQAGCEALDMGRSPAGSGASQFKSQWAAHSVPVYQQVMAVSGQPAAESIAGRVRTDSKFQTFTRVWSRLPFPVTLVLGPRLRRHVPFA